MTSEAIGIDSESFFFYQQQEYKEKILNLISRRQHNDRRKSSTPLCQIIRERMAKEIDGGKDYFWIDSKSIEICRPARSRRCSMEKTNFEKKCLIEKPERMKTYILSICQCKKKNRNFILAVVRSVHDYT